MRVVADNGSMLDATFFVENGPLSMVYESAGGIIGVNSRNRDYSIALPLLLRRLGDLGVTITEIRVDSVITRQLTEERQRVHLRRHSLPIVLGEIVDFEDLKRDISSAAREPGAREDASRGGSSRRLRFMLRDDGWVARDLESAVATPRAFSEAAAVRAIVSVAAGRTVARFQGLQLSPVVRKAIELHAMERAKAHYDADWDVKDVHQSRPYDLECRRHGAILYVEVKGSTTTGEAVIVTPNEVEHARDHHPDTELFIVSEILVENATTGAPRASGGIERSYRGWGIDESRLRPLGFEYIVRGG